MEAKEKEWLVIGNNNKEFSKAAANNCLMKFDNGDECRYQDEWPFAIATHYKPV